jgi:putative glutamine amidotransferase
MKKITIGITHNSKYDNYARWIGMEPGTQVVRLGYAYDNFHDISRCHGILLSGGDEDIHPRFYNCPEYLPLCTGGVDERRDEFELRIVDYAISNRLPLLGICRGLQIMNVYCGGTLVPDIRAAGKPDHSRLAEGSDRHHSITVPPDCLLGGIAGLHEGEVNSSHHQSADRIGEGLMANAISDDGVIEGLERRDNHARSFLLLVQWHPERMGDQTNRLASTIKTAFLDSVR